MFILEYMKFSKDYLKMLSEKLLDLGNLSIVGLSFMAFFSKENKITGVLLGISLFILFYIISFIIGGKTE